MTRLRIPASSDLSLFLFHRLATPPHGLLLQRASRKDTESDRATEARHIPAKSRPPKRYSRPPDETSPLYQRAEAGVPPVGKDRSLHVLVAMWYSCRSPRATPASNPTRHTESDTRQGSRVVQLGRSVELRCGVFRRDSSAVLIDDEGLGVE
eukprot:586885-Rhodomonas_salina.1